MKRHKFKPNPSWHDQCAAGFPHRFCGRSFVDEIHLHDPQIPHAAGWSVETAEELASPAIGKMKIPEWRAMVNEIARALECERNRQDTLLALSKYEIQEIKESVIALTILIGYHERQLTMALELGHSTELENSRLSELRELRTAALKAEHGSDQVST